MAMGALQLDDRAPAFNLPSVDGHTYSLETFADKPVLVVIFRCNHCPYVQAYEDRMVASHRRHDPMGPLSRLAPPLVRRSPVPWSPAPRSLWVSFAGLRCEIFVVVELNEGTHLVTALSSLTASR